METQTNVEAANALTDNGSASGLTTAGIVAATSSYSNYDGDSSIPAKVSKYREFVDSKYELAKGAYTYSAYTAAVIKQDNGPIPIVAFFGVKLRFPEFSEFDCPNVQFQHRDILGDRIFMIAVSRNESDTDIYSVFVNRSWFLNLYDRFIREGKELSSATKFQSDEIGKPQEYLEILSRNQVHDMHYGFVPSTGYESPTETFELTGTLEEKGQKMLLLHLMQEAIYDSKQFLSNQISLLEQQRMDEKFSCYREEKSATSVVDNGSNSGGVAEFNNGDEVSEEEQLAPQSTKKKGSSKSRALQAIETSLRYGHLSEEQHYEGKRLSKPLIKFGSVIEDDCKNGTAITSLAGVQPGKTKVTAPHKVIAEKTNPPPKTTQQKAARTTKKTTKPATSTTGRRKHVQVKIEEEEEEEQEEEVQIVPQQKKPRGRPRTISTGAVSEAQAISSARNNNDLLMTMQRDYEKQFAQLKAENKKAAEQTAQQTAALTEALLKLTKDAEERIKTRELNEQQVVMSTGRGVSDRLEHTDIVPRTSGFSAPPSAPSTNNGFADTMTNFSTTRCSSQTPNQLQLLQQSALQMHSSSIQLQNNPNNLFPVDGMSNNIPPNMAMWAQYPQHHMQQPQHQHFMQYQQQNQQHYMQQQPYPQYYQQQQLPQGPQQQQSSRRRPNNPNGAIAAFLAGMLANTQQQDD